LKKIGEIHFSKKKKLPKIERKHAKKDILMVFAAK
jgi:hypothetical protein